MNNEKVSDVCIVGAGIAGSTCAFYLAKQGKSVLLLEREKFPRDKICGDAITPRAQVHLKRMGVLKSVLEGLWTVHTGNSAKPSFRSRVLIAADGANSRLARSLGIVTKEPTAICSRSYVEAGTFRFKEDGVCFYRPSLIPGYFSMFRQADGDLGLCCYIIPGGQGKIGDLKRLHNSFIKEDPFISVELGPAAKMEKMKAGLLRIEPVPESYSDHLLIVGDAAGQIDPLTGEGIQYAMDGGQIAAEVLGEAFLKNDFSKQYLKRYQKRCMKSFGRDFKWSSRMTRWFARHPVFLDAFAALCKRRGDEFMLRWAYIMIGSKPKRHFFRPGMALPLLFESFRHRRFYQKD